ncbi:MAG: DNA translocase FtsK, partial [Candidatus Tectomicrobia bacterium]|nr:DNA translocase FtsK [Candidatus Tectomicrobia bacterium]
AWYLMRRQLRSGVAVVWRGFVILIAGSTALHLLFRGDPFFAPHVLAGGISGQWLAAFCTRYLNPFGASLAVTAAFVLALFVGVDNRDLYRQVWSRLMQGAAWGRRIGVSLRNAWRWLTRAAAWLYVSSRLALQWLGRMRDRVTTTREADTRVRDPHFDLPADVDFEDHVKTGNPIWHDESREDDPLDSPLVEPEPAPMPVMPLPRRRPVRRRRTPGTLPSPDLLEIPVSPAQRQSQNELEEQARFLEQKLRDFGVEGEVVQVLQGPVITMFEYAPASGVKVSRIVNLQDDLALVMRALSVRVVAPIPGKAVVGIEIPNKYRETVQLRDILDSELLPASASKLSLALGKDIMGTPVVTDLALIPHLLIAGATGSGKSVGLNSMICTMLFRATPAEVKMIMVDPKMLELSIYEGIPHLLVPVVTNPKQAALALRRVVEEMERRYQLLAAKGVRSIAQYNTIIAAEEKHPSPLLPRSDDMSDIDQEMAPPAEKLPYLVVIIDELSDLMMVSSKEVEDSLTRIAQMARAAGIHLIVATQRPSVDVLTGVIKANFPARLSFQVTSKTDSRTILDANGAEKLLGRGDMLFLAPGTSKAQRVQSAYVSEDEINRLVEAWKEIEPPHYDEQFLDPADESGDIDEADYDERYDEAVALVSASGQASISMVQRRLRVGYNRAARMIEIMEKEGVVGPSDGVKPREVLVRKTYDYDAD